MPRTQGMQSCEIGLTKALLNSGFQNVLPRHKIKNKYTVKENILGYRIIFDIIKTKFTCFIGI
jgi:mRNA-degrading endonuclease RelE of RelBE toxin-antitoxin system